MSPRIEKLSEQIRSLDNREKAELAHALILDLDGEPDNDASAAWEVEIDRRYAGFQDGTVQSIHGAEAMQRIRSRIK